MKEAVCPECGEEYRLLRGSTGDQEGCTFYPVTCLNCEHNFVWKEIIIDE